jgi:electron transport complex protein RnfB
LSTADATHDLTETLDALLPQTQCAQCGYAGCRPYAAAIAGGSADFNRCPPGGAEVISDLAAVLGRAPKPLDISCGVTKAPAVAVIDEAWCIGCTLCIQACPVDAIAGAAKLMHTVIADACTGCELCIPPCPVDCIEMVPLTQAITRTERRQRATQARNRYLAREKRIAAAEQQASPTAPVAAHDRGKNATIARAMARAQARINGRTGL